MRNCIICAAENENKLLKYCRTCYYEEIRLKQKENPYQMKRSPIKRVWKKRTERLKNWGSERLTHIKVYSDVKFCQVPWCGKYVPPVDWQELPAPWSFPHILSKKNYPHLRNFVNNYFITCWIWCHEEIDRILAWNNKAEIEKKILNWEIIVITDYE